MGWWWSMMHRHAFEALDIYLPDKIGGFKDIPFGNKIIVFGEDFWQISISCKEKYSE